MCVCVCVYTISFLFSEPGGDSSPHPCYVMGWSILWLLRFPAPWCVLTRLYLKSPTNHEIAQVPEGAVSPLASQPTRAILCPPRANVFPSEFQLPLGGEAEFLVAQISQSPTYQYAIKLHVKCSFPRREICHGVLKLRSVFLVSNLGAEPQR